MGRSHVSMCAELPIQQTIHSETFRTNCRQAILVTRRQSGPSLCERKVNSRAHAGEGLRHVDHQQVFRHRFNHPLRLGLFPKTFLKVAQPAAGIWAIPHSDNPVSQDLASNPSSQTQGMMYDLDIRSAIPSSDDIVLFISVDHCDGAAATATGRKCCRGR